MSILRTQDSSIWIDSDAKTSENIHVSWHWLPGGDLEKHVLQGEHLAYSWVQKTAVRSNAVQIEENIQECDRWDDNYIIQKENRTNSGYLVARHQQ